MSDFAHKKNTVPLGVGIFQMMTMPYALCIFSVFGFFLDFSKKTTKNGV